MCSVKPGSCVDSLNVALAICTNWLIRAAPELAMILIDTISPTTLFFNIQVVDL